MFKHLYKTFCSNYFPFILFFHSLQHIYILHSFHHIHTYTMNSSSETLVASEPPQTTKEKPSKPTSQVRWAPIRGIPIERRLQMLAVCTWISMMFILVSLFFFMATYKFMWPILIAYISFLYVDKAPESGGRRFESARHWALWRYFAAYFPAQLIKVSKVETIDM